MKKSTYDAISTIALVSVVVFTIASQHSSRAGYVFGILAVLTAAGLFVAYIKALPRSSPSEQAKRAADQAKQAFEEAIQLASKTVAQRRAMERNVRENLNRSLLFRKRALYEERLKERQLMLFFDALTVAHHGTADIKAGSYFTQLKFHREPVHDSASIIANIVQKLCATSKEPRFEFILEPNGSFKIQQISAKRTVAPEPIATQEKPVEELDESEKPQLIN